VPKTFGLFPGRVTYVIDKEGVVGHVFASQLSVERHVQEALRALSPTFQRTELDRSVFLCGAHDSMGALCSRTSSPKSVLGWIHMGE
jgi:alkyl hydroperoxide reductase subunit AhpC